METNLLLNLPGRSARAVSCKQRWYALSVDVHFCVGLTGW